MESDTSWIVAAIVAAEVAFWIVLAAGLSARYLLRWRRVSTVLLVGVPVVDLALIAFVALDLSHGNTPTTAHGLAAVYLGFSVGFGHYVISKADGWFAFRFAGAPRAPKVPRSGPARVRHEWRDWSRALVAWAVAVVALLTMKAFSGWSVPSSMEELWSTDELWSWVARLTLINIAWFVTGPVYASLFRASPSNEPDPERRVHAVREH